MGLRLCLDRLTVFVDDKLTFVDTGRYFCPHPAQRMQFKTLSSILFAAASLAAQAQITIVQGDLPAVNDPWQRTQAVANPLLNFTATGPGHTWNFATLHAQGQETEAYQAVSSTNLVYALVFADLGFNPNRANLAKAGVEIAFSELLPVEDPYTFRHRSGSAYKTVGFGMELSGLPVPVIFDEHDVIYELPLNFGNTSTSFSRWNVDVPTLAYYGYEQLRTNVVDGWGTVTTPAGSFDALRVKSTIEGADTVQIDELSLGFSIERPVVTEYKWLAKNVRVPVLQINTVRIGGVELITEVWFYDLPRNITVDAPLSTTLCPGATVPVHYTRTGSFNQGSFLLPANVFRAQLSDASGSFDAPVVIGSVTSNQSGTINATIPLNTPAGSGYRIRVVATSPGHTGNDNGFDLAIGALPLAVIDAAGATTFCAGGGVELSTTMGTGQTYQWAMNGTAIPGADGSTLLAEEAGSYTVQVTNACGSTTSAAQAVVVHALPVHELSDAAPFTCAGEPVSLSAIDLSGQSGLAYQWYLDGEAIANATSPTIEATMAGAYTVTIGNDATTCTYTAGPAVLEVETVAAPELIANGPVSFCEGGSVVLEATGIGAEHVWWSNGEVIPDENGNMLTAQASGTYAVASVSTNGCTSELSEAVTITVNPAPAAPAIAANGPTAFCAGGSVVLSTTAEADAYEWSFNGTPVPSGSTATITADATGTYTLLVTDANGCSSSPSEAIEVLVHALPEAPVLTADGPTTFCSGSEVLLSANGTAGQVQWTLDGADLPGATGSELLVNMAGTYSAWTTDAQGCGSASAQPIVVVVHGTPAAPEVTVEGATTFCAGGSVVLSYSGTTGYGYQWYQDETPIAAADGPSLTVEATGTYTLVVTSTEGCASAASTSVVVTVDALPDAPVIVQDGNILSTTASGDLQWYLNGEPIPGATGASIDVGENGDYTVVVTSPNGCTSVSEVFPFNTVGTAETVSAPWSLFPNPCLGDFSIRLPWAPDERTYYTVHDATGKQVLQGTVIGTVTPVHLPASAAGLYFVQVVRGKEVATQRLVVGR